jgi:hypothetical protein
MKKVSTPLPKQFQLFVEFIGDSGRRPNLSNSIDIWESIPKYFFSTKLVEGLRDESGHAETFEWEFSMGTKRCEVRIQPAQIKDGDGGYISVFPGVSEEIMEEVLKKLLSEQCGDHQVDKKQTLVYFTLYQLREEHGVRGRTRSIQQLKRSIDIMSGCIITLFIEGAQVYKGPILADVVRVSRESYLAEGESRWVARLPLFITEAINTLQYRQFNYGRLMSMDGQLSRWLYHRLIHKFTHTDERNNYHILYTTIEEQSGLLQGKEMHQNRKKVMDAIKELTTKGVIVAHETHEQRSPNGRTIKDVKYELYCTEAFIAEQKASNYRRKMAMEALETETKRLAALEKDKKLEKAAKRKIILK